jgi:hypothetical protein
MHDHQVAMSWTAHVKAQRAKENCDYVRKLLSQQQPEFADALAAAEQELTCQADLPRPRNAPPVRYPASVAADLKVRRPTSISTGDAPRGRARMTRVQCPTVMTLWSESIRRC